MFQVSVLSGFAASHPVESDPAGGCIWVPGDVLIEQAMVKMIKAVYAVSS